MELEDTSLGSPDWSEARKLHHALFFQPHGQPMSVMDDGHEARAVHLVAKERDAVIGYGRLAPLENGRFQISQMVVRPDRQHRGVGRAVLRELLARAAAAGVAEVVLNARVDASTFYETVGFAPCGEPFPSKSTGVPHIQMSIKVGDAQGLAWRMRTGIAKRPSD